jgi:hypothetical protein
MMAANHLKQSSSASSSKETPQLGKNYDPPQFSLDNTFKLTNAQNIG